MGRRRQRFTEQDRKAIVRWLSQKADGKARVIWADVEKYSGFSKMRLNQDAEVVHAYQLAKEAFRGGSPTRTRPNSREQAFVDTIDRLQGQLRDLELKLDHWCVLWDRWQYNAHRMGWDVAELERPLPPARHRKLPKGL